MQKEEELSENIPDENEFETTLKVLNFLSENPKYLYQNKELLSVGQKVYQKPVLFENKKRIFAETQKESQVAHVKKQKTEIIEEVKDKLEWRPIGYFNSCFKIKNATPRQGQLCPMARGKFSFLLGHNPEHAIEDLKEFSHVWLIWLFHENREKPFNENTMKMKIRPPRLNGDRVSIFSTRTPHRPNPIGLSRAKIEKIVGPTIYLSGIDLIDGTPIIDIKPYIPKYDSIQKGEEVKIAKWIESPSKLTKVEFKEESIDTLKSCIKKLEYFDSLEEIMEAITQVLQLDPRGVQRKKSNDSFYAFYIDNLNVVVTINGESGNCTVDKIELITNWDEIVKAQHDKVIEQKFPSTKNQHTDDSDDIQNN
eukprot:gene4393-7768_t